MRLGSSFKRYEAQMAPSSLTSVEKAYLVVELARTRNMQETKRNFEIQYGKSVSANTSARLLKRFLATGTTDDKPRSGRPRTVGTETTKTLVRRSIEIAPGLGSRRRANESALTRTTLRRLMKELEARCWRPRMVQVLSDGTILMP